MSTRSSVKIDGINMYSHCDGYESGMVGKLYQTIKNLVSVENYIYSGKKSMYIKQNRFINAFIAGNINNCEIDINREIGGQEYIYKITTKNMNIKAYSVTLDGAIKLFFNGAISDFIEEYKKDMKPVFEAIEVNEYNINNKKISLYTKKQRKKLMEYYKLEGAKFSDNNPNKKKYNEKYNSLLNAREI